MRNYLSSVSKAILLCTSIYVTAHSTPSRSQDIVQQPDIFQHNVGIQPRCTLGSGFIKVLEGSVALIEYMGEYHVTDKPGLHYHAPLFSTYIRVDTRTILVDTPQQIALTRDMQKLVIDGSFAYRITDPCKAVYNVQNLENNLTFLFFQSVLSRIAQLSNDQAISLDKNEFSWAIQDILNNEISRPEDDTPRTRKRIIVDNSDQIELEEIFEKSSKPKHGEDRDWGVEITKVAITNIAYPESIVQSMNAQREAEYQKKIMETNANAQRQKMEIDAEANKRQVLVNAEASKARTILEAEARLFAVTTDAEAQAKKLNIETQIKLETARADAEARIIKAKSEAEAIELRAKAEANAKIMMGDVYANHPELMRRDMMADVVTAMKDFYTSANSKIIFSDGGEKGGNNFVKQLITMQAMCNENGSLGGNHLLNQYSDSVIQSK